MEEEILEGQEAETVNSTDNENNIDIESIVEQRTQALKDELKKEYDEKLKKIENKVGFNNRKKKEETETPNEEELLEKVEKRLIDKQLKSKVLQDNPDLDEAALDQVRKQHPTLSWDMAARLLDKPKTPNTSSLTGRQVYKSDSKTITQAQLNNLQWPAYKEARKKIDSWALSLV